MHQVIHNVVDTLTLEKKVGVSRVVRFSSEMCYYLFHRIILQFTGRHVIMLKKKILNNYHTPCNTNAIGNKISKNSPNAWLAAGCGIKMHFLCESVSTVRHSTIHFIKWLIQKLISLLQLIQYSLELCGLRCWSWRYWTRGYRIIFQQPVAVSELFILVICVTAWLHDAYHEHVLLTQSVVQLLLISLPTVMVEHNIPLGYVWMQLPLNT